MKPEEVIGICKGVIEPITEKLFSAIESLPSKDDIKNLILKLETRFNNELAARDKTIYNLETRITELETQRKSDTDKFIELSGKITALADRYEHAAETVARSSDNETVAEKPEIDLVVLGDSIVKLIDPKLNIDALSHPLDTNEHANLIESISGGTIPQIVERATELHAQFSIKNLILHVGSNHIPEMSPLSVSYGLIRMIEDIRELMPDTNVYFSAILPKLSVRFNFGIDRINEHIYNVSTMMNFHFIRHERFCSRGIVNERLYRYDRIHPSHGGSKQLEFDFRRALNGRV